jgi:hypothetical protein
MSDESDNREGWTGMGIWWMSAAALIAAVVIGLAIVLFLPRNDKDNTGSPTPSTAPTTPPSSSASSSPSASAGAGWAAGCNTSVGSTEIPVSAPEATWDPLGGSSVPVSTTYGPSRVNGSLRECYQHSPAGALFATVTIMTALGADPAGAGAIARAQIAPGPGRDTAIEEADAGASDPAAAQTIAAYRFTSCGPDRCNLDAVFAVNGGVLARTSLSAVWNGSDWQLDAAALSAAGVSQVDQVPAGFISWEPGR